MGISHYLAMTAAEIEAAQTLPQELAYMACHFAPYGTGLIGCPEALPNASMLIINDRIPYCGHDVSQIADQLSVWVRQLSCSCILLDFQRADTPVSLGKILANTLCIPVGISPDFAGNGDYPVFLPPAPPDQPLETYLQPWTGREIWLENTPEIHRLTLDNHGCRREIMPAEESGAFPFSDTALHCHYRTEVFPDRAVFTLRRTAEDSEQLLVSAEALGVTRTVSLYQHVKKLPV